jgi:hypothetical protein
MIHTWIRKENPMPRTVTDIEADLTAAYARDRELVLRTPEYRFNSQHLAALIAELASLLPQGTGAFTPEDYDKYPDSGEQMYVNRKRAEAFLRSQKAAKAPKQAELDRLYLESRKKEAA